MKIGHIIILVIVLLAVHTPVSGQRIGQTTDKIFSYLVQNDAKNARALLATINTDSLELESDSVKYMYHFEAAYIDELEFKDSQEKLNHLKLAKEYLEKIPDFSYDMTDYPLVVSSLGRTYRNLGMQKEAILTYEDGLIKCLPVYNRYNAGAQETVRGIVHDLISIYKKQGNNVMAEALRKEFELEQTNPLAVVDQMIDSARIVMEARPEEALKLLDGAEKMLRNTDTGNADPAPAYFYLYLSKFEPLARLLKIDSLKSTFRKTVPFFQQLEPQAWFTKYTDNINGMAVVLSENEHFAEAMDLYDFLRAEAARYHEQVDSLALTTEKNVRKRYQFKLDNDALVEAFKKEKDVDKWVHLGIVASNYYYRRSHPEEAVHIALQVYQRVSADEKLYQYKEETLRRLIDGYALANDYARAYPYVLEFEQIVRGKYGEKQEYADIRNIHAVVVMDVNLNEARECLDDAGKILSELHGDDSEEMIPIMGNWGRWYQLQKNYEQARHFYAKARDLQMKYYGEVNPLTRKRLEEVEYALSIKL